MAIDPTLAMTAINKVGQDWTTRAETLNKSKRLKNKMGFWETLKVGGLSAVAPSVGDWYINTKLGRQMAWQEREAVRARNASIDKAAELQTEAAQDAINKQLDLTNKGTTASYANQGAFRTGSLQKRLALNNQNAFSDLASIAQQNAMQAEAMKQGLASEDRAFNFEVSKLEAAKRAGDAQLAGEAAENLAPLMFEKLFGGGQTTGIAGEEIYQGYTGSFGPASTDLYPEQDEISGGEYTDINSWEAPSSNAVESWNAPANTENNILTNFWNSVFKPQTKKPLTSSNETPMSVLWGN